jgi:hypothetical protein
VEAKSSGANQRSTVEKMAGMLPSRDAAEEDEDIEMKSASVRYDTSAIHCRKFGSELFFSGI